MHYLIGIYLGRKVFLLIFGRLVSDVLTKIGRDNRIVDFGIGEFGNYLFEAKITKFILREIYE